MPGFQRGCRLLGAALRTPRVPRAHITSKPPEHPLSTAEQVIGFSVMSVCFLLPAAWILAHLEHYKSRSD